MGEGGAGTPSPTQGLDCLQILCSAKKHTLKVGNFFFPSLRSSLGEGRRRRNDYKGRNYGLPCAPTVHQMLFLELGHSGGQGSVPAVPGESVRYQRET